MKKSNLKLPSLILLASLSFATPAQSALLVDKNYSQNRLEKNSCITEQDKKRLGINQYGNGTQANFRTEKDLFELITKFYTCENQDEDKIMYMLTFNNRKTDNSIRTIMHSLTMQREDIANMPKKMKLYSTIDEVIGDLEFQKFAKKIGEENIFFEAVDVENHKFLGLYDVNKELLVTREDELKKYNFPE